MKIKYATLETKRYVILFKFFYIRLHAQKKKKKKTTQTPTNTLSYFIKKKI